MEIVANLVGYTTNLAALIRRPMQELGSNSVLLRHSPTRLTREEASRFEQQDDLKLYTPGELCTTCLTDGCVLYRDRSESLWRVGDRVQPTGGYGKALPYGFPCRPVEFRGQTIALCPGGS